MTAATARRLPTLQGPPGREHVPHLQPPAAGDRVQEREGTHVPRWVLSQARTVAEALFATEEGPPDPARIEWLVAEFGALLSRAGGRALLVHELCLTALTWFAPLLSGTLPPLSRLDWKRRTAVLERIEASAFGPAALGPKAILCMLWFEHPDTQRETGTEPSCKKNSEVAS